MTDATVRARTWAMTLHSIVANICADRDAIEWMCEVCGAHGIVEQTTGPTVLLVADQASKSDCRKRISIDWP